MRRARRTRIVATLGPASSDSATIRALLQAGADVFRLNFSHGTRADHAERLAIVRKLETEFDRPVGVMLDLQGPQAEAGQLQRRRGAAGGRSELSARPGLGRGRRHACPAAAPRDIQRDRTRHRTAARRRQTAPARPVLHCRTCRHRRRRRRPHHGSQGGQRPGPDPADLVAHAQGPRRSGLRPESGRRLGRAVFRATQRGRAAGARDRRRPGMDHGQA